MTVRRAVVYAVLLAAAASLWLFTHSERAQVRRVFADVERLAAKEQGEPVMECAGKAQALARHFRDGCEIVAIPRFPFPVSRRKNIIKLAVAIPGNIRHHVSALGGRGGRPRAETRHGPTSRVLRRYISVSLRSFSRRRSASASAPVSAEALLAVNKVGCSALIDAN